MAMDTETDTGVTDERPRELRSTQRGGTASSPTPRA